jgi:small subunit ribosomal protein S2e
MADATGRGGFGSRGGAGGAGGAGGDRGRGRGRGGFRGRGRRGAGKNEEKEWQPVTKLGRLVKLGKIKTMEEIYLHSLPIKEYQIVDYFLPKLKDEVMKVRNQDFRLCKASRILGYDLIDSCDQSVMSPCFQSWYLELHS